MIRLAPFDYYAPAGVAEAVALKVRYGGAAMYVGGGTDLFPKMKRRQFTPEVIIDLSRVEGLATIAPGEGDWEGGLTIGATATLAQVAGHPLTTSRYPALAGAAGLAASPALRNSGTLGGNLCLDTRCNYYDQSEEWRQALGYCMKLGGAICQVARSSPICLAVSSSDCAPVVIALRGVVRLAGPDGGRLLPAEELYREDGAHYLAKSADELLTAVHLPAPAGWRCAYWKLRRRDAIDFPVLGVAAALQIGADGRCRAARLALGAVSSRPLLLPDEVVAPLIGQALTAELLDAAASEAARLAKPMDNTDMALGYRKKMAHVFVRRALMEAAGLPG